MRLRRMVGDFWSRSPNACNVAIGYPPPVLRPKTGPVLSFTPMRSAAPVAAEGPNRSVLVNGRSLPLQNVQLDRLLLVHALEFDPAQPSARGMLARARRRGTLMVMVPNRNGCGRARKNPLRSWQAFSRGQLRKLLADHGFNPVRAQTACSCRRPRWTFSVRPADRTDRQQLVARHRRRAVVEAEKNLCAGGRQAV